MTDLKNWSRSCNQCNSALGHLNSDKKFVLRRKHDKEGSGNTYERCDMIKRVTLFDGFAKGFNC